MYRISQLAERSGLSRSTLLYYEKLGLLRARRRMNGYRDYSDSDLQRLTLIQQFQAGGLTLQECKACLDSQLDRELLEQRLQKLDEEIAAKQAARNLLVSLLGTDDEAARNWHHSLEESAPDAHFAWLQQQGFSERDALRLRRLSRNMHKHEDYMNDFEKIFAGLDHLGPGSEADSLQALASVPEGAEKILDVGCGTGASSLILAQQRKATVVALDDDAGSLHTLEQRAQQAGLQANIKTCCASMLSIPFADKAFDLIWSEGSAYIMGFEKALKQWRRLLCSEGYLVVSDLVWTCSDPEQELRQFWTKEYPDMQSVDTRLRQAEESGYSIIDHFHLSDIAWKNYIGPLATRITELEPSMPGSQAIADLKEELEILRRFNEQFSYMMMVLKKND